MDKEKVYHVEVTETLQRTVEVRACNPSEAIGATKDMYRREEIVLDAGDHIDTDYKIIEDVSPTPNLEQEIADRIVATYGVDNDDALDIVQDVIDIYELRDHEHIDMLKRIVTYHDNTYGRQETLGFLMSHLDLDETQAVNLFERIIKEVE